MSSALAIAPITAKLVPFHLRRGFMCKFFGRRRMLRGENSTYQWMKRLHRPYLSAPWNYYELSNGGFYLAPIMDPVHLDVADSGYHGTMSSDAAGIVVTLFVLRDLVNYTRRHPDCETLLDRLHLLRAFAHEHAEADAILAATD